MFENFMSKTKEEKKEVLKTAGKITLGVAGAGALGFILGKTLGFRDGIDWFWEKGREMVKQKEEEPEEIEDKGEGEA